MKLDDLTGRKFGRLTVIKRADDYISPKGHRNIQWLCKCDCGNEAIIRAMYLKSGHTQSCGCLREEMIYELSKKYNTYDLSGEYGIGYTSKGEEFWFDLEDYDLIKNYMWSKNDTGYIRTATNGKTLRLHRLIMNPPSDMVVDHINHIVFDNRKENLRIVTGSQSNMNQEVRSNNTSGVTGVRYSKDCKKWQASINKSTLGYFVNFEDAVKSRKEAEEKYFGEYSYDNSMKKLQKITINT